MSKGEERNERGLGDGNLPLECGTGPTTDDVIDRRGIRETLGVPMFSGRVNWGYLELRAWQSEIDKGLRRADD